MDVTEYVIPVVKTILDAHPKVHTVLSINQEFYDAGVKLIRDELMFRYRQFTCTGEGYERIRDYIHNNQVEMYGINTGNIDLIGAVARLYCMTHDHIAYSRGLEFEHARNAAKLYNQFIGTVLYELDRMTRTGKLVVEE